MSLKTPETNTFLVDRAPHRRYSWRNPEEFSVKFSARLALLLAVCLFAMIALQAGASTINYNFNFTGSGYSGAGVFTLTSTATAGTYNITGVSGTTTVSGYSSATIASLLAPGVYPPNNPTYPNQANDNLAFTSGPFLDYQGVSYSLTNGLLVNLFYNGSNTFGVSSSNSTTFATLNTFTATPQAVAVTPEPPSVLLLATGVLAVGALYWRRRQSALETI